MQEAPIHQSHVINITWTVFKRVIKVTFLWNYFKIRPAVPEKILKQEGQDGPGSLTWFFEIALAIFFLSFSEKN